MTPTLSSVSGKVQSTFGLLLNEYSLRSANSKKLNFCGLDVRSDPIKVDCNENCIFLREFFNVLQPFFKDLKFIFSTWINVIFIDD